MKNHIFADDIKINNTKQNDIHSSNLQQNDIEK